MKKSILICSLALLSLSSCKKVIEGRKNSIVPPAETPQVTDPFVEYSIKQGEQYCDKNNLVTVKYDELKFLVKFDSSAIYKTMLPENQGDINKLFGFSDNNAQHHEYSARFGWGWSNNALRLYAYVYNEGIRSSAELGTVKIGTENKCSLKVAGNTYIFTLNNKTVTMPRLAKTPQAQGYKLYPYFGGDEPAPHLIKIWIKEL